MYLFMNFCTKYSINLLLIKIAIVMALFVTKGARFACQVQCLRWEKPRSCTHFLIKKFPGHACPVSVNICWSNWRNIPVSDR